MTEVSECPNLDALVGKIEAHNGGWMCKGSIYSEITIEDWKIIMWKIINELESIFLFQSILLLEDWKHNLLL